MGRDTLTLGDVALGTRWFRSAVAWQPAAAQGFGVDRMNRIIHGVAVVTKGEALGHDMWLDDTFLDEVVEHGNRTKAGVKSRFDHPNASGTSMGTMLGRVRQLRRDGDIVRGDLHLLESATKTPDGDLAGYVMDLAEEDPQAFGASIVFTGDSLEQKDDEGKVLPQRLARLKKLMAADVVDSPAANPGGMFSVEDSLAAKATEFLDRYFRNMKKEEAMPPEKVAVAETRTAEMTKEDELLPVTAPVVLSAYPEVYHEIYEMGVAAERARILGIQEAMFAGQDAQAQDLIANGTTIDQAKDQFIAAEKLSNKARLEHLKAAAPKSVGGGSDTVITDDSALPAEERWDKEYAKTPALRAEFGSVGAYQAFKAAESKGWVKILQK